jgi:hypothetical protein
MVFPLIASNVLCAGALTVVLLFSNLKSVTSWAGFATANLSKVGIEDRWETFSIHYALL